MNFVSRREKNRKPFKTSRNLNGSPEALAALGRQIKTPFKYTESNHWPEERTGDFRPVALDDEPIVPGMGHVTTYHTNIAPSGRYRGIDLTRKGTEGIGGEKNATIHRDNERKKRR